MKEKREPNNGKILFECECKCGNKFWRPWNYIRNRDWLRCRKCPLQRRKTIYKNKKEAMIAMHLQKHIRSKERLIGHKNGYLKVIKFSHWKYNSKRRFAMYEAKCKCGKKVLMRGDNFYEVKSCGCLRKEKILRGENHPHSKIKNENIKVIRELYSSKLGYRIVDLANMFEVEESTMCCIIKKKTYKNI